MHLCRVRLARRRLWGCLTLCSNAGRICTADSSAPRGVLGVPAGNIAADVCCIPRTLLHCTALHSTVGLHAAGQFGPVVASCAPPGTSNVTAAQHPMVIKVIWTWSAALLQKYPTSLAQHTVAAATTYVASPEASPAALIT